MNTATATRVDQGLAALVADSSVFYQKLRHYHWHVTGDRFFVLHEKFEELYLRWAEIVDEFAERLVSRGQTAPRTLAEVLELSSLEEDPTSPDPSEMVGRLAGDLEHLIAKVDDTRKSADEEGDGTTVNLMEDVRDEQRKVHWMLKAWLS